MSHNKIIPISYSTRWMEYSDQFAFCPTGSTTAALIWILYTITQLLCQHDYVIVLALDFSKAFDSVRHSFLWTLSWVQELLSYIYWWL